MGLLDSITVWFKNETADVKEAVDNVQRDLDADLSRKEREMHASPSERIDMLQDEIDESENSLDAIRDRIDQTAAHAAATEELAADDPPIEE